VANVPLRGGVDFSPSRTVLTEGLEVRSFRDCVKTLCEEPGPRWFS
jgi:hypothetical protein